YCHAVSPTVVSWTLSGVAIGGIDGEQVEDQGQRPRSFGDGIARYAAVVRVAQRAAPARAALRLRSRAVWCLLGVVGREGDRPLRTLPADPDGDQAGRRRDGEGRQVTMTGLLHEKEFSRKNFLKGGGALIVGFSVAGAGLSGAASAAGTAAPPLNSLDSWLIV